MPSIHCPIAGCAYVTGDVDAAIAAALLMVHNNVHTTPTAVAAPSKQKAPKIQRPSISRGGNEETWNTFNARWRLFKEGTSLSPAEVSQQLFECCDEELGNDLLKNNSTNIIRSTESDLLAMIKRLAVTPVAVSVRRSDLLTMNQCDGESVRSFFARIKGKADTCAYSLECTSPTCTQVVDFTDIITKDVLVSGLSDDEVKREVLGWHDLDTKTVEETATYIEAKEMARDAMNKSSMNAALSSYKKKGRQTDEKVLCKDCHTEIDKLFWSRRQKKMVEKAFCSSCWSKKTKEKSSNRQKNVNAVTTQDEAGAITIGGISEPLDHLMFDSGQGWKKMESMRHPSLKLSLSVDPNDYAKLNKKPKVIKPRLINVITDTGAQSCLWGLNNFLQSGFSESDLLPVRHGLYAANGEKIPVNGAILLRLSGTSNEGDAHSAAVMTYISPSTNRFYLSREAMIQLNVISKDFPKIGATVQEAVIGCSIEPCGCPRRSLPPGRPSSLPFDCIPGNNIRMRDWLMERYSQSTFNQCTHQQLPGMKGPSISLHVDPDASPHAVHTPASVPLHWQDAVKKQLDDDVQLGVLEKVPIGEPSLWCHRMVITSKSDGSPRRTVDLSPLNAKCLRETHHVKPPFLQAKAVPPDTWKSVTDAWNGFHSVPIVPEDRHYTTFITSWGRYRYKKAPQGFLASGDGYSRRFDEIIADIERKTKCVDDTLMWDTELENHWWRIIDFLGLLGKSGIILNKQKFQFAQRAVDFAGFHISEHSIRPLQKFIAAIRDFPTPSKITDVRSWFGLVNQVAHYDQLSIVMEPFKHLLSPKSKFQWTNELEVAFSESKQLVIEAIEKGVEIFDPKLPTCLRPDWSKSGIGFYLSQKHCQCSNISPTCCKDGWKITLAGSRFLRPAETRYAPVEGEALAIAWSLEQTKYFTQGCSNLLVITDHKPLVKLFGDRTLDEIANPRLFRLKQRTLMWRFTVHHQPGKENHFSDATSRHPVHTQDTTDCCINYDCTGNDDDMEIKLSVNAATTVDKLRAITWDILQKETQTDPLLCELMQTIRTGFPEQKCDLPRELIPFWNLRESLYIVDNVVLMKHRAVIPKSLRSEVLQSLHSAHQGETAMANRARQTAYWPGIDGDIKLTRDSCYHCCRNAPSQPRLPPVEPYIPTVPFEAICSDYFYYKGAYYFIAADRLSGWTEQSRIKPGTKESGAAGLCTALRKLFATFGIPVELTTDGGPEFSSKVTKDFLQRWGVRHRVSSAYLPSSNGRAELAVKAIKRLLMDNIDANGDLDNDKVLRALLMKRNTPDPGCKLSPAEVLFGHPLRDSLSFISKDTDVFTNPEIAQKWKKTWQMKEESLRTQYIKSMERLDEHSKSLPPLKVGDQVFVQNQTGRYPTRWDRSGIILAAKEFDQYLIKVAGSGRITLRNRRYIRKFEPHLFTNTAYPSTPPAYPSTQPNLPLVNATAESATEPDLPLLPPDEVVCEQPTNVTVPAEQPPTLSCSARQPVGMDAGTDNQEPMPRRSLRVRNSKKFYDPETGTYVTQNP